MCAQAVTAAASVEACAGAATCAVQPVGVELPLDHSHLARPNRDFVARLGLNHAAAPDITASGNPRVMNNVVRQGLSARWPFRIGTDRRKLLAEQNLGGVLALRVERRNSVGDRIFIEGNADQPIHGR